MLASIMQIALGNVCMMNVAYAEEGSQSMMMQHGGMEMVMSPVIPMSPLHCLSCVKVEIKQAPPFTIPCEKGHCVSHTTDNAMVGIPASHPLLALALPVIKRTFLTTHDTSDNHTTNHSLSHRQVSTKTIVLLN